MVQSATMDGSFLIGLALAVPLSISANLLTPKANEFIARTSYSRRLRRIEFLDDQIAWFDMLEKNWPAMYSMVMNDASAAALQGMLVAMVGCIVLAYAFADAFDHISGNGGMVNVSNSALFQWGLVPFAYAGCLFLKGLFLVMSNSGEPRRLVDRKKSLIVERDKIAVQICGPLRRFTRNPKKIAILTPSVGLP
jgi:hypothetical protein